MPRFFRRLAKACSILEDLNTHNELADFVTAAAHTLRIRSDSLLRLVIRTAPTSLRACYCFGRRICAGAFYFERWCRDSGQIARSFICAVWIGAGDQDPIIPASETKRLVELLRRAAQT
jgi:hypothetical protein